MAVEQMAATSRGAGVPVAQTEWRTFIFLKSLVSNVSAAEAWQEFHRHTDSLALKSSKSRNSRIQCVW